MALRKPTKEDATHDPGSKRRVCREPNWITQLDLPNRPAVGPNAHQRIGHTQNIPKGLDIPKTYPNCTILVIGTWFREVDLSDLSSSLQSR